MARWTSAAATAESTPPDRPQIARPSPTCARISSICSSMMLAHGPGRPAARGGQEPGAASPCRARCACTSGWNCTPYRPRPASSAAATGVAAGPRGHGESRRRRGAGVAVRHPHLLAARQAVQQHARPLPGLTRSSVAPYSPPPVRCTAPPRSRTPSAGSRSRCRASGTPASSSPAGAGGAPAAYTDAGPPDRMIAAGFLASISRGGHGARDDLASTPGTRAPGARSAARTGRRSPPRARALRPIHHEASLSRGS